jgi:hypothetical protein
MESGRRVSALRNGIGQMRNRRTGHPFRELPGSGVRSCSAYSYRPERYLYMAMLPHTAG